VVGEAAGDQDDVAVGVQGDVAQWPGDGVPVAQNAVDIAGLCGVMATEHLEGVTGGAAVLPPAIHPQHAQAETPPKSLAA
jgi:hypothetical protein